MHKVHAPALPYSAGLRCLPTVKSQWSFAAYPQANLQPFKAILGLKPLAIDVSQLFDFI